MERETVCSVEKENKLGFYRLHTVFDDSTLKVNVTSKDGAWTGQVSKSRLEEMSRDLQRPVDVYVKESLEALTTSGGKPGIVYAVEDNSFVWKAVDNEIGMKIKLGGIPLQPANFVDTIQTMMQVSLNRNQALQETILRLEQDKISSKQNVNEAMQKLNEFEKSKQTMEDELYTTFVAVLNTKKRKIKELEIELIEERAKAPRKRPREKKKVQEANPYNEDTDDDALNDEQEPSTSKSTKRTAQKQKSRKAPIKGIKGHQKGQRNDVIEVSMLSASSDEDCSRKDLRSNPNQSSAAEPSILKDVKKCSVSSAAEMEVSSSDLPNCSSKEVQETTNNSFICQSVVEPSSGGMIPESHGTIQNPTISSAIATRSEAFLEELLGGPVSSKQNGTSGAEGGEILMRYGKSLSIQSPGTLVSSKARDIIDEFF